jgi:hypothetical protein
MAGAGPLARRGRGCSGASVYIGHTATTAIRQSLCIIYGELTHALTH